MKATRLFVAAVCAIAFGGCVVKGPEVRIKPPIEIRTDGGAGGGTFCPPGQAKKGNC